MYIHCLFIHLTAMLPQRLPKKLQGIKISCYIFRAWQITNINNTSIIIHTCNCWKIAKINDLTIIIIMLCHIIVFTFTAMLPRLASLKGIQQILYGHVIHVHVTMSLISKAKVDLFPKIMSSLSAFVSFTFTALFSQGLSKRLTRIKGIPQISFIINFKGLAKINVGM